MEKIIEVLTNVNEDVEELLLLQVAKARKNEATISYEEYKKEVAAWK